MLPSKKWERVIRVTRMCARACGADVGDKNFKITYFTAFIIFLIALFFLWTFYSVYISVGDFNKILAAFCTMGKGIQGASKLASALIYSDFYCEKIEFLTQIYQTYETKGKDYELALHKCASRVQSCLRIMGLVYIVGVPCVMATPLFVWLYDGRLVLTCGLILPGIDINTIQGYRMTLIAQLLVFTFGGFGNFASDLFFFEVVAHFSLFADITRLKAKELNELADHPQSAKCMDALLDVLKWHQTYSKFTENADHIFFWVNFLQITTSALSIVIVLVLLINGEWSGAYGFICLEFSMMYMYCVMGSVVEVANDNFTSELYAMHWYTLTIPQQKIVRMMLMKSQSPKELTVGGVIPLSVNTGLQLTKTIYSVFMMLLNLFYE